MWLLFRQFWGKYGNFLFHHLVTLTTTTAHLRAILKHQKCTSHLELVAVAIESSPALDPDLDRAVLGGRDDDRRDLNFGLFLRSDRCPDLDIRDLVVVQSQSLD